MNKQTYIKPEIEIISIDNSEIIATSDASSLKRISSKNWYLLNILFNRLAYEEYSAHKSAIENKTVMFYPSWFNNQSDATWQSVENSLTALSACSPLCQLIHQHLLVPERIPYYCAELLDKNEFSYSDNIMLGKIVKTSPTYFQREQVCISPDEFNFMPFAFHQPAYCSNPVQEQKEECLYVLLFQSTAVITLSQTEWDALQKTFIETDQGDQILKKLWDKKRLMHPDFINLCKKSGCYNDSDNPIILSVIHYKRLPASSISQSIITIPVEVVDFHEVMKYSLDKQIIERLTQLLYSDMLMFGNKDLDFESYMSARFLPPLPPPPPSSQAIQLLSDDPESEEGEEEEDSEKKYKKELDSSNIVDKLGTSPTALTSENVEWIKMFMPIPKEFTILWAEVVMDRAYPSGVVFCKEAFCFRASQISLNHYNEKHTDQKTDDLYFLISWIDFSQNHHFQIRNTDNKFGLYFNDLEVVSSCQNKLKKMLDENKDYSIAEVSGGKSIIALHVGPNFIPVTKGMNQAVNIAKGEMVENAVAITELWGLNQVKIEGRDNARNGADLIINGRSIQSKFCKDAKSLYSNIVTKNRKRLKYIDNSQPMAILVPNGMKDEIVQLIIQNRIDTKNVDPNSFIIESKFTITQAENLCKFGTIESLKYDLSTGGISCSCNWGITFVLSFAQEKWNGRETKDAAMVSLSKACEGSFSSLINYLLIMQTARTEIGKKAIKRCDAILERLISDNLKYCYKGITGNTIQPAALTKVTIKKHMGRIIESTTAFTALTFLFENTYNYGKSIYNSNTWTEYMKDLTTSASGMVVSGASTLLVSMAFSAMVGSSCPVLGTIIGAVVGMGTGIASAKAVESGFSLLAENDNKVSLRMLEAYMKQTINDYLLNSTETKLFFEEVKKKNINSILRGIRATNTQVQYLKGVLEPLAEDISKKRTVIKDSDIPTEEEMRDITLTPTNNNQ